MGTNRLLRLGLDNKIPYFINHWLKNQVMVTHFGIFLTHHLGRL